MTALVTLSLVPAPAADAIGPCFDAPGVLGGLSIPPDGTAEVPTNATPIVDGGDLEVRLVGPDGVDVPVDLQALFVEGGSGEAASLQRLIPAGELSPGQTYTLIVDGQLRSTFTVGLAADTEPPANPDASFEGGSDGCGAAFIGVASDDAAFFIGVVDGRPVLGADVRLNGLSLPSMDNLVLFGTGTAQVNVAAVDFAGNVSGSVPVDVVLESSPVSCASGGKQGSAGLALALGLLVLRPRRREASRGLG